MVEYNRASEANISITYTNVHPRFHRSKQDTMEKEEKRRDKQPKIESTPAGFEPALSKELP